MAFNPAPTDVWSGYDYDAVNDVLEIPLADLPGLTAADCDPTTGDFRAIALALVDNFVVHYDGTATADRPTAFTPSISNITLMTTGDYVGNQRITYQFQIICPRGTPSVADEV